MRHGPLAVDLWRADLMSEAIGQRRSDAELIKALRKVASLNGGRCTSSAYYECYMAGLVDPSPRTFTMRYGSWVAALRAAGLTPAKTPPPYANRTPDAVLLAAVRRCAADLGYLPTLADYRAWRTAVMPCDAIIRTRLGGWRGVLRTLLAESRDAA
jgi:hypothetical protein